MVREPASSPTFRVGELKHRRDAEDTLSPRTAAWTDQEGSVAVHARRLVRAFAAGIAETKQWKFGQTARARIP